MQCIPRREVYDAALMQDDNDNEYLIISAPPTAPLAYR